MPLNLTTASGLLKEFYSVDGGPRDQLHQSTPFLAQLQRTSDHVNAEGSEAIWGIHVGRNWGVGFIGDGGAYPTAGNQTDVKARQPLRTAVIRCEWTHQVWEAARSTRGSLRKAVAEKMMAISDLRRQISRSVFGTADGAIATAGTTTASTTLVLADTTTAVQMRQFEAGMRVDIGTLAAPTTVSSANVIVSVNATAKTLTLTSAVTTSAAHFVFLSGSGGGPGTGQLELDGLQHVLSTTTTLYGLAPATYPAHVAVVDAPATARPLTPEALELGLANSVNASGYDGKRLGVMSPHLMVGFEANLRTQRRYSGERSKLEAGFSGIGVYTPFGEVTYTQDKDCPAGNVFELATDAWLIHEWRPADWIGEDGESIIREVPGFAKKEAIYEWIFNIATTQRNANWRGTNFIEPS